MPEPYGILLCSFFSGATGRSLQARGAVGKDALILAAFLSANTWANMIGLYEVSLAKIARELPVLKGPQSILRTLAVLEHEQYAQYDEVTEFVWVREMARVRLNLVRGELTTNTNRRKGADQVYQRMPMNPFLGPFFDRYHVELGLRHRRGMIPKPFGNDSEVIPKPFGNDSEVSSVSPQTPLQVPEISTSTRTIRDQGDQVPEKIKAAAAPRRAADSPEDNVEIITSLVQKELLPLRLSDLELPEVTKSRCAELRIAYDSGVVRKAIESAQMRSAILRRA